MGTAAARSLYVAVRTACLAEGVLFTFAQTLRRSWVFRVTLDWHVAGQNVFRMHGRIEEDET